MTVLYLDSLFLLNLVVDYLLLLLTGQVAGQLIKPLRLFWGALAGSLYGTAAFFPGLDILFHPAFRIGVGILMVLIAYGSTHHLLRVCLVFAALSAAFGGGLYALSLLTAGSISFYNGMVVASLDLKVILVATALCYCLLGLVFRKSACHGSGQLHPVEIYQDGRCARLVALTDSGHTLTDPITGGPVMVVEGEKLALLLPPEADFHHPTQCFLNLHEPKKFRLLPYRAVGIDCGLLLAMRPDKVRIDGKEVPSMLIALSPTPVSDGGGYSALIPAP